MRGSNNRLDDENRDRNNGNRLFDSQNNNRGGYNRGNLYYYQGSEVYIDWTAQHSCGGPNNNCEVIVQVACDPLMRDGTDDRTIPTRPTECYNLDCDTDVEFGRHESHESYMQCTYRRRNEGLFTANQRLRGPSARFTRQNPDGNRRGLECPEERDYYPYWNPTMWRDVAIFTNNPTRCPEYKAESQNVKSRWFCDVPRAFIQARAHPNGWQTGIEGFIPITKEGCENITFSSTVNGAAQAPVWREVPALGVEAPLCRENFWSRDNHLGNVEGGYPAGFNWTVPSDLQGDNCVFRIRYNISTGEYDGWLNSTSVQSSAIVNSSRNFPTDNRNTNPSRLDVWSKYNLNYSENADCFDTSKNGNEAGRRLCREYVFQDNPEVDIFGSLITTSTKVGTVKLQLAIDTDQFGRTFQDRSHVFSIRPRPAGVSGRIVNINVQGKRGNIVQTFPGTEYDFVPYHTKVATGDFVHFQWTGSNSNPHNNAGQGRAGTDRHNVIAQRPANYWELGLPTVVNGQVKNVTTPPTFGHWGNNYPMPLPQAGQQSPNTNWHLAGLDYWSLWRLATTQRTTEGHFGGDLDELDAAATYFDLGLRQVTSPGIYHYLCTRNNNFSNRSQKSKIVVSGTKIASEPIGWNGGSTSAGSAQLNVPTGALTALNSFTVASAPSSAVISTFDGTPASDYVTLTPLVLSGAQSDVTLKIKFDNTPLSLPSVYRADSIDGSWSKVDASFSGNTATVDTSRGGVFVVEAPLNAGAVAGIVIGVVVFIVLVVVGVWYYRRSTGASAGPSKAPVAAPAKIAAPPSSSSPSSPASSNKPLPAGWQAVTDPNDGATYYVNATQGLSQWEFPDS